MTDFDTSFWRKRVEQCGEALSANNFSVYIADRLSEAEAIFREQIFEDMKVSSASWGDSMSLKESGILEYLKSVEEIDFIDTFDPSITREQSMELRRRALLVDLFLTGSNAVTEDGCLVNLDMIGNRVGGITPSERPPEGESSRLPKECWNAMATTPSAPAASRRSAPSAWAT